VEQTATLLPSIYKSARGLLEPYRDYDSNGAANNLDLKSNRSQSSLADNILKYPVPSNLDLAGLKKRKRKKKDKELTSAKTPKRISIDVSDAINIRVSEEQDKLIQKVLSNHKKMENCEELI
jgi:hypothetical protein